MRKLNFSLATGAFISFCCWTAGVPLVTGADQFPIPDCVDTGTAAAILCWIGLRLAQAGRLR